MNKPNLNSKQVHLLKLIYRFRFVTADLVASYKHISKRAVNDAFSILLKQEYIARHYNSSYRLHGKSARYYLAPKALKLLRDKYELDKDVLHASYKDKSVSEAFIDHNLGIFSTCLAVRSLYPDQYTVFTKSELVEYDYFPKPYPDLYVTRTNEADDKPSDFMIDIFENTLAFIVQKRVDQYIQHYEDDEWVDKIYPAVILICPNSRMAEKIQKYIEGKKDDKYIEDGELRILTTTQKALLTGSENAIWSISADRQLPISLDKYTSN